MVKTSYSEVKAIVENYELILKKTKSDCDFKIANIKSVYDQCVLKCTDKIKKKEALVAKWKKIMEEYPPEDISDTEE